MLLVVDIGNTNTCVGGFKGEDVVFEFRLKTDTGRTVDEVTAILDSLFARKFGSGYKFDQCIVSSVVPPVTQDFVKVCREMTGVEPVIVGPGIKTGLKLNVQEPNAVGADRVVNAVAVKHCYGAPGIVVDFGTATTFDIVGKSGDFEGGVICPGMNGALESLVRNTAKLPKIELVWPKSVIGKNTVQAMQAGSIVGYVCLIDGLLDKTLEEIGPVENIIATGGLGRLVSEHSRRIKKYDQYLTLKGLKILAEMNR